MNRTSGRVSIPQNVGEMLALAASVYQKHQNEGEGSPLNNVDGLDWSAVGPTISQALEIHKEAEALRAQMEMAYRERDRYTPAISNALKISRNLLKAINQTNPKRIADWGFTIDDTVQAKK